MTVRHWPLGGHVEQFYSGGFLDEQADLRRLLRQIARWMQHDKDTNKFVDAVVVYPHHSDNRDEPTTWAAGVWMSE